MSDILDKYDLVLAGGLAVIIVALLFLSRITALPKKNLVFIGAALAALLGVAVWKKERQDALKEDLKQRERKLKELEARMAEAKQETVADLAKLEQMKREQELAVEAQQKQILLIEHERDENIARIEGLSGAELREEYRKKFEAL